MIGQVLAAFQSNFLVVHLDGQIGDCSSLGLYTGHVCFIIPSATLKFKDSDMRDFTCRCLRFPETSILSVESEEADHSFLKLELYAWCVVFGHDAIMQFSY